MKVEQFVMAYEVEQDRLRAFLADGFVLKDSSRRGDYRFSR